MAIFYLAVQTIRRAAGRSAVAAAAYRTGRRLRDDRTGEIFDYRRRSGVLASGRVGWDGTSGDLWNAAEAAERRQNAVVAREVVLALPHELDAHQRQRLTTDYAAWLHARHGVAVEWAVHSPDKGGDARNCHAHLMLTTRRVEGATFGPKTRELDQRQHSRIHVEEWRRAWARMCNDALRSDGLHQTIDHRSLRRQAKALRCPERLPQLHLGPAATHLARRGILTRRARENLWRQAANAPVARWHVQARRAASSFLDIALSGGERTAGRGRDEAR